jgi:GNAT superfamily N-acetyltransferase
MSSSPQDHDRQPAAASPPYGWVPIRVLAARHLPRIVAHLQALDEHDRYLRFGSPSSDAQVEAYARSIHFERDEVFGVFDRRLRLVAMAHLAYPPARDGEPPANAEFGVSVAKRLRGRGVGERLFAHAALHARQRGVDTLLVHALSENKAMLHIARKAGATIERDGPDSRAVVRLPPETLATRVETLVEEQAANLDYGIKRGVRRVDDLLTGIAGG